VIPFDSAAAILATASYTAAGGIEFVLASGQVSIAVGKPAPPPPPPSAVAAAATTEAPGWTPASARDRREAPLRKLTTGLLSTYRLINTRYYEAKAMRQVRGIREDYNVVVGDMLGQRYRVLETKGKGSFGQVVACTDVRNNRPVAIKVIKNKDAFRRQARSEIRLLELLNTKDEDDQWCIGV
ncbi:hypothetical protein EON66_10640, partial [archaeon]